MVRVLFPVCGRPSATGSLQLSAFCPRRRRRDYDLPNYQLSARPSLQTSKNHLVSFDDSTRYINNK